MRLLEKSFDESNSEIDVGVSLPSQSQFPLVSQIRSTLQDQT